MNCYVLKDLIESLEYSISELKKYRYELKYYDNKYDQEVADEITKALKKNKFEKLKWFKKFNIRGELTWIVKKWMN